MAVHEWVSTAVLNKASKSRANTESLSKVMQWLLQQNKVGRALEAAVEAFWDFEGSKHGQ